MRKVIAERMLASLQTTAQLTLNASADARGILAFRKRLKASPDSFGLQQVTINDLVLFAVARTLPHHPDLNAHFSGDTLTKFKAVHLGLAVDTPRGLMVPVIRNAHQLSLKQISQEAKRLAAACQERRVTPDELSGGTFTVTNLGSLGIESFTPVLNPPEVAILGVSAISLKAVEIDGDVQFVPHLGLSLTINHQVVDGAPGARFLQALAQGLKDIDLLLACSNDDWTFLPRKVQSDRYVSHAIGPFFRERSNLIATLTQIGPFSEKGPICRQTDPRKAHMTKLITIDPAEARKPGVLRAPEIPINAYVPNPKAEAKKYGSDTLVRMYRDMVAIREFETMLDRIKKEGVYQGIEYNHRGPAHLSIGQESAAVGMALQPVARGLYLRLASQPRRDPRQELLGHRQNGR